MKKLEEIPITYDGGPISMQEVVQLGIKRMGIETNNVNWRNGEYENLRAFVEKTGVSKTAVEAIAKGSTKFPSERIIQGICLALQSIDPPIINPHTGEPIPTDWIELLTLNQRFQSAKNDADDVPEEDKAPTKASKEDNPLEGLTPDELETIKKLARMLGKL